MNFYDNLLISFNRPLPGEVAQNLMAPQNSKDYRIPLPNHKIACVVILLHFYENQHFITFIQRAQSHPEDKHAGQISFPGGKLDPSDISFQDCALRELEEELGIDSSNVKILGQLTPLYVYVSNFLVYPFVGFVEKKPIYTPQVSEVADVLEIPLNYFSKPHISKIKTIEVHNRTLENTPYYDLNGHILWGASAMILSEFLEIVRKDVFQNEL